MTLDGVRVVSILNEDGIDAALAELAEQCLAICWVRATREMHERRREGSDAGDAADVWVLDLWWHPDWYNDRNRVRRVIEHLVEQARGDQIALENVGAGPLEEFVTDADEDLLWIESMCQRSTDFRIAAQSAQFDQLTQDARSSIAAACASPPTLR